MKQNISVFPSEALPLVLWYIQNPITPLKGGKKGCRKRRGKGKRQLKFLSFPVVLTRLNKIYALR